MNRQLTFTVLAGSFSGLLFGYDIGAMAGAAPDLRAFFGLSPASLGVAVSAALFGTILGSAAAGFLSDALGRRLALFLSAVIYGLAVIAAAVAQSPAQFAVDRCLCGIALGLISVAAPMYLAEVAPPRLRGRVVGSFQLSLSIGVVAAFAAGDLLSGGRHGGSSWRLLLTGGVLPALLTTLCLLRAAASPGWLALRRGLRNSGDSPASPRMPRPQPGSIGAGEASFAKDDPDRTSLFSRRHLRPLALGVTLAIFNQLTGVNALLYYVLDVFRDLGSGNLNGRADATILAMVGLFVTLAAVLVIDSLGRKPLLLAGSAGMGICLFLLPAIRQHGWPAVMVLIVLACYDASFGFSQGAVIWVYLSEIFPLPVRARGQSVASTVHWAANAFVVGTFPVLTSHMGERVFPVLAFLMILQFVTILVFYPETKGRTIDSVASSLSG